MTAKAAAIVGVLGLSLTLTAGFALAGDSTKPALSSASSLLVWPERCALDGPMSRQRLLISGEAQGRSADLSPVASYRSENPAIADVSADGTIRPIADGETRISAIVGDREARIAVKVTGMSRPAPPRFEADIMPILTRLGCNSGPCHGKARGQNGFQLSLLGFDPESDFAALTKEARGRRVFPASPIDSLILRKGTASVPHGGGRKIEPEGPEFQLLLRWIAEGMPRSPKDAPQPVRLTVEPSERILAPRDRQRLAVTAHFSDGSARDVTHLAAFTSNETAVAAIGADGVIQCGPIPGEAAISARFRGMFATCSVAIPVAERLAPSYYGSLPKRNFIDGLVWEKLAKLGIAPSDPAGDLTFQRRAYLDVIGRLPSPDETRAFFNDPAPSAVKRDALIDQLLQRPEYADFWANKWVDLLRPNPYRVGIKAVLSLDSWVRDAFRRNVPYDQFVKGIVTARGSTFRDGASVVFRDRREPEEVSTMMSQLFLGIRLECAKCHHHPFEVWGQDDFYGFAAHFARIARKGTGLSPPISGSEEIMFTAKEGTVRHPLTGESLPPKPLFGQPVKSDDPDSDPREDLFLWMTSSQNPYFDQVIVNRVWAELMGKGIVDPVDDLRATNPPSNAPLLEALAKDFRDHDRDLKHLLRTIMTSHVYALSSTPNDRNKTDHRNFSRHYRQRLRAEVLLDALCDALDVPERFAAAPPGSRAVAIWTHRTPSLFLDTFGRPDPNQDPPCERTPDSTVTQTLHLMNSPDLQRKLTDDEGRAAKLAATGKTAKEIAEELYLLVFSRLPDAEEATLAREMIDAAGADRAKKRQAIEDLLWALLNSAEFVFKD